MNFLLVALCVFLSLAWGLGLEVDAHERNPFNRRQIEMAPAGGVGPARDGAYPHMVSLEVFWEEANLWVSACAGTLVSLNKVLTSASCYTYFKQYHNKWQLVAGRYDLYTPREQEQILDIGTVHIHPNFNHTNGKPAFPVHDYALVITDVAFESSGWVKPLLALSGPNYTIPEGELVTGVGWELSVNTTSPFEMQELNQTVISMALCQQAYDTIGYDVPKHLWCAGLPGEIPDNDLRGGPLVHNGTLVGVGTLPFVVGSQIYPSLYSNVSGLASWIEHLQKH